MTREDAPAAKLFGASDEKQIAGARVKSRVRFEKGTGDARWRPASDALRGRSRRRSRDYAEDEQCPTKSRSRIQMLRSLVGH